MDASPRSRVKTTFIEHKTVTNVPWTCDMLLKFDNGMELFKGNMAGTYKEVEASSSDIFFHTEYLEDDEAC